MLQAIGDNSKKKKNLLAEQGDLYKLQIKAHLAAPEKQSWLT